MTNAETISKLERIIEDAGPVAVAVSGGVDSMTLATLVHRIQPDSMMIHAQSPAVPEAAGRRVCTYAKSFGWNMQLLDSGEMQDPHYRNNPLNRCYHCKSNLYRVMRCHTGLPLVSGTNCDDLTDFRPGLKAAAENAVRHPYVEAGIDKAGVRELASWLGLAELKGLPASPCLSSRISTGTPIDENRLRLIDAVEVRLRNIPELIPEGAAVRCRIRQNSISIELERPDLADGSFQLLDQVRQQVSEVMSGFSNIGLDSEIQVEPYRQGSSFIRRGLDER